MGVPVVTLCGRRHGERSTYSILANLGVLDTVAHSASDYVAIAARLADDRAFRAQSEGGDPRRPRRIAADRHGRAHPQSRARLSDGARAALSGRARGSALMAAAGTGPARVERARQRLAAGDIAGARREAEAILAGAGDAPEHVAGAPGARDLLRPRARHQVRRWHTPRPRWRARPTIRSRTMCTASCRRRTATRQAPRQACGARSRSIRASSRRTTTWAYCSARAATPRGAAAAFDRNRPPRSRACARLEQSRQYAAHAGSARRGGSGVRARRGAQARLLAGRRQPRCRAARSRRAGPRRSDAARDARPRRSGSVPAAGRAAGRRAALARHARRVGASCMSQAINAAPSESAGEWFNLGLVLAERNDPVGARNAYGRARTLDPTDLRMLFGERLTLPMVYADAREVDSARAGFEAGLATLERELLPAIRAAQLTETQVLDGLRWVNFFLAYQGRDDRDLQARYAATAAAAVDAVAPHWRAPIAARPVSGRRVRVGFASAFFHTGTCGRYFKSWITDLDRERFEVFVYHLWPGMDDIAQAIEARADHFRTFAANRSRPSVVAPAIRADDLDVLVYTELGHGRHHVRAGGAAAGAAAIRGVGASGHDRARDDRRVRELCGDGNRRRAVALHRKAGPAAGHRDALRAADRCPRRAAASNSRCPTSARCCCARSRCGRSIRTTTVLFAEILAANPRAMLVFFGGWHPAPIDRFMQRLKLDARRVRHPDPRADARAAAGRTRRLSAHQHAVRRHGRHLALVGRQQQPRCAGLQPAGRHAARAVHARPPERGHAFAAGRARA